MKIETKPLEDHQVKLVVEVEPEPFEKAKRRAASRLSRRTKIPGFRPGKAPYRIVQRHLGDEAILDESLETSIRRSLMKQKSNLTVLESWKISLALIL